MPSRRIALVAAVVVASATALTSPAAAAAAQTPPAAFVVVSRADPSILSDIRYATRHNFIGRPITGYLDPVCILTREAATALSKAQRAVLRLGYTLKVYDCYRPQRAVDDFVAWAEDLDDQAMKREFYPAVEKSVLFEEGYISARSGHSRGSTLDLTLVKLPPRPKPTGYRRPPHDLQHFVPDHAAEMLKK